jgi:hypothetical protein
MFHLLSLVYILKKFDFKSGSFSPPQFRLLRHFSCAFTLSQYQILNQQLKWLSIKRIQLIDAYPLSAVHHSSWFLQKFNNEI